MILKKQTTMMLLSQLGWVWNMTLRKLFLEILSTLGCILNNNSILKLLYTTEMFGRGDQGEADL